SKGDASSSSAAVSGSASIVIWPPKCVIVSEVHSLTKSALRHSPFNILFFPMRDCASRVARDGKSYGLLASRPASNSRRAIGPAGQSLPLSGTAGERRPAPRIDELDAAMLA